MTAELRARAGAVCWAAAVNLEMYTDVVDSEYLLATLEADPFAHRHRRLTQGDCTLLCACMGGVKPSRAGGWAAPHTALCELVGEYGLVRFHSLNIQVRASTGGHRISG
jgi:hypothetical protein